MATVFSSIFKISRKGRKLAMSDDPRILVVMPKEISCKTWADMISREETDLIVYEIREEIVEKAIEIVYESYMERQLVSFTSYCVTQAWEMLIDWAFYRHDPGEDPSAHTLCYIPKRSESWVPDKEPEPSPRDPLIVQELKLQCDSSEEGNLEPSSFTSLNIPILPEIPSKFWFPGKVNLPINKEEIDQEELIQEISVEEEENQISVAESEVVEKITDYLDDEPNTSKACVPGSVKSAMKPTSQRDGSLQGAGDATLDKERRSLSSSKSKGSNRRIRKGTRLPPLDINDSTISDCQLRYQR